MLTQQDYKRAQRDSTFRKEFVNRIDLEPIEKYVKYLIYVPKSEMTSDDKDVVMRTVPRAYAETFRIPRIKSCIEIFPASFGDKSLSTLDDFLGTLYLHEGYHAKEMYYNPWISASPIIADLVRLAFQFPIAYLTKNPKIISGSFVEKNWIERELRASENQFIHLDSRDFSQNYITSLKEFYEQLREDYKKFRKNGEGK